MTSPTTEGVWYFERPFTQRVTPLPQEIDGLNHTNNAVYVQWCEKIAWARSQTRGLGLDDYRHLDRAMAIRRSEYDDRLPSVVGDELTLGTWLCASDGKLSMERRFQLVRQPDQATLLRARWHLVCIELSSARARRTPPEFCRVYLPAVVGAIGAKLPNAPRECAHPEN
ncbi:MAG: thioesterase family protein [Betaproteobacteria bacterium]